MNKIMDVITLFFKDFNSGIIEWVKTLYKVNAR